MAKSILVITDAHDTEHCSITKAHDIAAPLGDDIDVIRFIKSNEAASLDDARLEQESQALETYVQDLFQDYQHKGSNKTQVVVSDDVAQWVIDYCQDKDFDLVVKAGHRSETLFHTPCDWELIRSLQIPVLIANQQRWKQEHAVLAALDPNAKDEEHRQLNTEILEWTKKWANTFNCEIHLVYCLPVSNILKELDIIDVKEYARTHRSEGERQLAELINGYDLPNVHMHVTAGSPARTIPHCANELKAELVIMGSTGRRGLKGVLLGNVAEKVMHHLRTDSLIVELES
ncbi:universal stress protein [Shewanella maritima]|uniref:universal stress protein n=1 Tax=Shewanella maritima TaxID=2520507 RepID=UPI003734E8FA